nr:hypothetical protein [Microbispora sp. GKU 823]
MPSSQAPAAKVAASSATTASPPAAAKSPAPSRGAARRVPSDALIRSPLTSASSVSGTAAGRTAASAASSTTKLTP